MRKGDEIVEQDSINFLNKIVEGIINNTCYEYKSVKLFDDGLIISIAKNDALIMALEMDCNENDMTLINNFFIPQMFKELIDVKFDDGKNYIIHAGNFNGITYKNNIIEFHINNLVYEQTNFNEIAGEYYVSYAMNNENKRNTIYFRKCGEELFLEVKQTRNNKMIVYENCDNIEEFYSIIRFVSNILGTDLIVPIYNHLGFEVIIPVHKVRALNLTNNTDTIYDRLIESFTTEEILKLYSISKHYMYQHDNVVANFTLNFAAFDEKMKFEYLKQHFNTIDSYENLYTRYNEELKTTSSRKLSTIKVSKEKVKSEYPSLIFPDEEILLKDILNKEQKKIFKAGIESKENKLNNLPLMISSLKYREDLMELCRNKFKKEGDKEISDISSFSEIRYFKNQKIWLLFKILTEPAIITTFRNLYLHTTSMQHEGAKLRAYAEIIQLIMYYINLRELEITESSISLIYDCIIYNWNGKTIL